MTISLTLNLARITPQIIFAKYSASRLDAIHFDLFATLGLKRKEALKSYSPTLGLKGLGVRSVFHEIENRYTSSVSKHFTKHQKRSLVQVGKLTERSLSSVLKPSIAITPHT